MQPHFNPHRNTWAKHRPPAVSLRGAGDSKHTALPRIELQDLGKNLAKGQRDGCVARSQPWHGQPPPVPTG